MRKLIWLLSLLALGCSSGEEAAPSGETVSTVPKMSREEAARYSNILPGNKAGDGKK